MGTLRRLRRSAGDHRRREPPPGPHRPPRLPRGPCLREPAALYGAGARPSPRYRRPVDRTGRHAGPVPLRRPDRRGRAAATARRRTHGPPRRTDTPPDRRDLPRRLGPGPAVRAYRHRSAPPPPRDGRHLTRPHGPAGERAGRDDGPQPPRPRRPGPGLRPHAQLPSPAGEERDADGRAAGGMVERRRAGAGPARRGIRLRGHGPRHDPARGRGHTAAGHRRRTPLRPSGGPFPRRPRAARRRTRRHAARAPCLPVVRLRPARPGPPDGHRRPGVRQGRHPGHR